MEDHDTAAANPPSNSHATRRPRWVNIFVVLAVVVVVLVVAMLLVGGHGPGQHAA